MSGRQRHVHYDRVSTKIQALVGYSGGDDGFQLDACRAYSEGVGADVVATITDVDSGANWNIKGLADAVERAKRGEYDVLVVYHTSRFARDALKKAVYEAELRKYGVRVHYLNAPIIDTSTPDGRMVNTIMSSLHGAIDELDRERRAVSTADGRRKKAREGKVVGAGVAPYGHAYVTVRVEERKRDVPVGLRPDPTSAPVVERLYREIGAASSIALAERLTSEGVPLPGTWTPSEARPRPTVWSPTTIRGIIRNTVHRGLWRYGDQDVVLPYTVVDDAVWHAAQRALSSHGRRRQTRRPERVERASLWLLRGRLDCGHCGGAISTDDHQISGPSAALWPERRMRRYQCARSVPTWARRAGKDVCVLPGLLAADERAAPSLVGIEDAAWAFVSSLYSEPGVFEARLAELDARTGEARSDWERRLAGIDAELTDRRRVMAAAEREKLKLDEDDPRYAIHDEAGARAALDVTRLVGSRARYIAAGGPGLEPEVRRALEANAGAVRALLGGAVARGAGVASVETRRVAYELLRVRGTVYRDAEGVRIGRDGRVRIAWDVFVDNGRGFLKLSALSTSSGVAILALDTAA